MFNSVATDNFQESEEDYLEIQKQGAMMEVVLIEYYFHRDCQVVSSVNLRPPGQAGNKFVNSIFRPEVDQVALVVESRPRANEGDVALKDGEKLRKLIEAEFSQKATDRC